MPQGRKVLLATHPLLATPHGSHRGKGEGLERAPGQNR
jgi:hypothetical protein